MRKEAGCWDRARRVGVSRALAGVTIAAVLTLGMLGGILVASLSNYLSTVTPEYWQLVLGLIFIAVIVFFKGGVAGAIAQLPKLWRTGGPP